jgi:putative ABC transport system permease protein
MKKLMQSMRIAFRALTMNKLRSALTMLGIVIGVASVIATLAIGLGATHRIQDQIASIGSRVAVLGKTVVDNLFVGADAIGQTIRIKNVPFAVVGIRTPKGQSSQGQDQDDVILLPISTAKRKVIGINAANADAVNTIMMQAKSGAQIPAAQEEAQALLRQRHHLQAVEADDFTIRNLQELFAAQEASSSIMAIMLAAVASVSLVVGGIGIMNIMLISVRERTREIGLPGHRRKDARHSDPVSG